MRRLFSRVEELFNSDAHTPPALYRTSPERLSTETDRLADGCFLFEGSFFEKAFGLFDNLGADTFLAEVDRVREGVGFWEDLVFVAFLDFTGDLDTLEEVLLGVGRVVFFATAFFLPLETIGFFVIVFLPDFVATAFLLFKALVVEIFFVIFEAEVLRDTVF